MDRNVEVLRHVSSSDLGIEIGPWHSPLAPKAAGYNCLSMDVFDTDTLRARAIADPNVPDELVRRIEHVDLVGGVDSLRTLVEDRGLAGQVSYIISSHNIEHIPDPITFLQDCGSVLKAGGYLSMAIPDRRACFDFFRPITTLSQWIQAHVERRTRPTEAQLFELECLGADYDRGSSRSAGFDIASESPERLVPFNRLQSSLARWRERIASAADDYRDTHCWAFTPSSFELLLRDCRHLGLVPLTVSALTPTNNHEFYVHLRNEGEGQMPEGEAYLTERAALLHRVVNESGSNSLLHLQVLQERDVLRAEVLRLKHGLNEQQVADTGRPDPCEIVDVLRADLEAIKRSTSWRITSPMRAVGSLLRSLR